jgi:lysyl endopeptidase
MRFNPIVLATIACCSPALPVGGSKPPPKDYHNTQKKGPIQIGEHFAIRISSVEEASTIKPVISKRGRRAEYVLRHEGAAFLSVHFSLLDLQPSCSLEITDSEGEQHTTLKGRGRHGQGSFWARHVAGDEMKITLECENGDREATFDIDDYVAGNAELLKGHLAEETRLLRGRDLATMKAFESPFEGNQMRELGNCNSDDKKNAVCFKSSHPTEYLKARAVARLYINGSGGKKLYDVYRVLYA